MSIKDRILYEDNHLIVINKRPGELVQGDETGDITLADMVKEYLKVTYSKPGNVYLGIPHRLDRPTSGIVVYAKTEKALIRLNDAFRGSDVKKTYWAVVDNCPRESEGTLVHYIVRDPRNNTSRAYPKEVKGSKIAKLSYRVLGKSDRYFLLEVDLHRSPPPDQGPAGRNRLPHKGGSEVRLCKVQSGWWNPPSCKKDQIHPPSEKGAARYRSSSSQGSRLGLFCQE